MDYEGLWGLWETVGGYGDCGSLREDCGVL